MIASAAVALTGTAVLLGSIPAGVKQVIVNVAGMGQSATDGLRVRFGASAGVATTGYDSTATQLIITQVYLGSTAGFDFQNVNVVDVPQHAQMIATLADPVNNIWVATMSLVCRPSFRNSLLVGRVTLPGVLDRIQLSFTGGSSFNAGKASYLAQ